MGAEPLWFSALRGGAEAVLMRTADADRTRPTPREQFSSAVLNPASSELLSELLTELLKLATLLKASPNMDKVQIDRESKIAGSGAALFGIETECSAQDLRVPTIFDSHN